MERYVDIKVAATVTVKVKESEQTDDTVLREIRSALTTHLDLAHPTPHVDMVDVSIDNIYLDK